MPYTVYEGSIVAAKHLLTALNSIITKAEAHANAASFPSRKLAEDMLPLSFQVWSVCKLAESQAKRLNQQEAVTQEYQGELQTYAEMHARIAEALQALEAVDRDQAIQNAEKPSKIDFGRAVGEKEISATSFCAGVGIPNMFFHVTIAYAILRNGGVELGKLDYLAPFFMANIGM